MHVECVEHLEHGQRGATSGHAYVGKKERIDQTSHKTQGRCLVGDAFSVKHKTQAGIGNSAPTCRGGVKTTKKALQVVSTVPLPHSILEYTLCWFLGVAGLILPSLCNTM